MRARAGGSGHRAKIFESLKNFKYPSAVPRPTRLWPWLLLLVLLPGSAGFAEEPEALDGTGPGRDDVEAELAPLELAYRTAPGNPEARRAYADVLFRLGDIWSANDVLASLATPWSSDPADLARGAELAYLVGDYQRAEALYGRLRLVEEPGSEAELEAIRGLTLVYYQTGQFGRALGLELPEDDRRSPLLVYMQKFEGEPNQVEWATDERVAHLPMVNEYDQPGALPLLRLEVNGHTVEFILDTGGDRLYIDEGVAERVGIRQIHQREAKYAYTKGETVNEPLGVAETVTMGEVTLRNVPVVVAKWKAMGPTSDGVVTTQMLKRFLSTVDYDRGEITFRERSERGKTQLLESFGEEPPIRMPFWMASTHLMFTRGSLNDRDGLNMLMDSGLALSMPMILVNETTELLGLGDRKTDIDAEGYEMYWVPIESHGIGSLTRGASQAVGNLFIEENPYWQFGFLFDALVSHQYLKHLGSWTIDFDTMTYYFPAEAAERSAASLTGEEASAAAPEVTYELSDAESYAGSYEIAPGMALEVTAADGVVFLQAPGQQKVGMEAVAADEFLIRLAGAKVNFERDDDGSIVVLVLDQAGRQTRAVRK